jgi:hypothetical protein
MTGQSRLVIFVIEGFPPNLENWVLREPACGAEMVSSWS